MPWYATLHKNEKNTIRAGDGTALYAAYMVNTVDMINTVDLVYTVNTIDSLGTDGFLWEKSLFLISRMADSRIYILKRSYWPGFLAPYPKLIFKNSLFSNFHHLDQILPS